MSKPGFQQTFQAGMVQDIDAHLQPPNSYRDASGIRLMYNEDGADASNGHGLTVTNAPGNTYAMSLPAGYGLIHAGSCSKGTLLFSTNNNYSEIGLWAWDTQAGVGAYQTLYNDHYDPNLKNNPFLRRSGLTESHDRLGWLFTDTMDSEVIFESELTERVYWTNRRGAMHCLNLNDCYRANGQTWHSFVAGSTAAGNLYYPKELSVHAFRERSDLVFPRLKLLGRGKGRLLSGAYQIAVQYRHKNGHESAWSPLTRRVFVTTNPLDDDNAARQAALRSNHHNRVMAPSGQMSTESLRYELSGIDSRWESVRVAVVYYESPDKAYTRIALKPVTIGQQGSLTMDIAQLDGDELTDSSFNQVYDNVLRVGTLAASDNMLLTGDLDDLTPVLMEVGAVSFAPKLRSMAADETLEPVFANEANPISRRNDNDPITNSVPKSAVLDLSAFTGVSVRHTIEQDYLNYKGQVYESLLKGHFRGETYEYGCAVLDRSGQVLFVQALPAFTFPEQYVAGPQGEPDYYALTKLNLVTNRYELRIMGLSVSGLALPVEKLYDQNGEMNVSGFMIVRKKRNQRIKHQGVVFPVCRTEDCWIKQSRDYTIFPLPTAVNSFTEDSIGSDRYQNGIVSTECGRDGGPAFGRTSSEAYYMSYHSPDVLIEEKLDKPLPGDKLKHVGIVGAGYPAGWQALAGNNAHSYVKSYDTTTVLTRLDVLTQKGRPALGDETRLSLALLHNLGFDESYKEFDKDELKRVFETQTHALYLSGLKTGIVFRKDSLFQRNGALLKALDWKAVDVAGSAMSTWASGDYYRYRLVNYLQATPVLSGSKEPYFSTGHYQPITTQVLSQAKQRKAADGSVTHYVFDEVEVWGGDCYVNPFDFTRLYPYWSECEKVASPEAPIFAYPDAAVSHVLPIESKYNLALRWGRSFAANATKPEATSCDNTNLQFVNGISSQQPEDWQYNNVLSLEETIQFYSVKDPDQQIYTSGHDLFQWTPQKRTGTRLDDWRLRYVANRGRVDGSLGPITKISKSSFDHVYIWQTNAVGAAPLNASQYANSDAGFIVISSGKVFTKMIYLSKESGTQHPESIWTSKGQIGAWDARNGVLLRHSQAGLDEISSQEHLHDLVQKLTVNLGASDLATLRQWRAVSGVDSNGDVLTSFLRQGITQKTLVYSPTIGAFVDSLPANFGYFGKRGRYLLSIASDKPGLLYLHQSAAKGNYFEKVYNSRLRFIINPSPTQTKRFDNGYLNINKAGVPAILSIRHSTPNGGVEQQHLIQRGDERMEFRDNCIVYPMYEEDWTDVKKPLRDHYAVIEIEIDNSLNLPVEILSFGTAMLTV